MATFLDATLLSEFTGVFTFLIAWLVCFGGLELSKPFGENRGIYALLSIFVAILFVMYTPARTFIEFVIPLLVMVAIAFFFIFFIFMALGVKGSVMTEFITKRPAIIIVIVVVIALFGLGAAFDGGGSQQIIVQDYPVQTGPNGEVSGLAPESYPVPGDYGNGVPVPDYAYPPEAYQRGNPPPVAQPAQQGNYGIGNTLVYVFTHPKFLGTAFLLLMGAFTIASLTKVG